MSDDRLAVFLPSLTGGGAERAGINLVRGIRDLGRQVDLILATSAGEYGGELTRCGIDPVDLATPRTLAAVTGLARYLARRRPACVFSFLDYGNVVALLAQKLAGSMTPIVPGIRNTLSRELELDPSLKSRAIIGLARRLYPRAAAIVANSDGVAKDAEALLGLAAGGVTVIANPALTPDLKARMAEPLDHPWFAAEAPPVVLACGRLTAQKDFATLIEAFVWVRRQADARLVILGDGEERAALQEQVDSLGLVDDVDLPRFDPNPFRYMARARVFALSSLFEGSPNVVIQALACGCAVVATDSCSGTAELLTDVPGSRLVPVGDAQSMAEALLSILRTERPRIDPGRLARFDYRASAGNYLALADRLTAFGRAVAP